MRALIVMPIVMALMLLVSRALTNVTGDPLSAVIIELILLITATSWFVGGRERGAPAPGGR